MATTAPLFNKNSMTFDEKVAYMRRLLEAKCETWQISIGMFKSVRGPEDMNTHGCVRSKKGENKIISRPAGTITEMVDNLIELLESL